MTKLINMQNQLVPPNLSVVYKVVCFHQNRMFSVNPDIRDIDFLARNTKKNARCGVSSVVEYHLSHIVRPLAIRPALFVCPTLADALHAVNYYGENYGETKGKKNLRILVGWASNAKLVSNVATVGSTRISLPSRFHTSLCDWFIPMAVVDGNDQITTPKLTRVYKVLRRYENRLFSANVNASVLTSLISDTISGPFTNELLKVIEYYTEKVAQPFSTTPVLFVCPTRRDARFARRFYLEKTKELRYGTITEIYEGWGHNVVPFSDDYLKQIGMEKTMQSSPPLDFKTSLCDWFIPMRKVG